jgi:hypothetical protein
MDSFLEQRGTPAVRPFWIAKMKQWAESDQPPMESTGARERKMLLDGRYLEEEFTGEMMECPFAGIASPGKAALPGSGAA